MATRPNILLFVPDGMQGRAQEPGGPVHTPNFDSVAQRGVQFTRAVTPLPTCSPARASIMTGLLPHNHGMTTVEHTVDPDQSLLRMDKPHWAQRLVEAGYRTGYFGKWHVEQTSRLEQFGWQVDGNSRGTLYAEALGGSGRCVDPAALRRPLASRTMSMEKGGDVGLEGRVRRRPWTQERLGAMLTSAGRSSREPPGQGNTEGHYGEPDN